MRIMRPIVLCAILGIGAFLSVPSATADEQRPNILFIIADDLGARVGCFGDKFAVSPNLDKLAEQGTAFQRCYTQRPTCGPSRASMLCGLYPFESGLVKQKQKVTDSEIPAVALPQLFREAGYSTARVGKVFHMGIPGGIGGAGSDLEAAWDVAVNNTGWDADPENYATAHNHSGSKQFGTAVAYLDPDITDDAMADGVGTREAIRLMESLHPDQTGKPLMLFMGYYRPHPPMVVPRKHWEAIPEDSITIPTFPEDNRADLPRSAFYYGKGGKQEAGFHFIPDPAARGYSRAYYAAVHFIDQEVGRLLAALDRLGLKDNTVIVFAGDQGFHLGEHGYWHKTSPFEPACRVPLIIVDPRSDSGGDQPEGLCGLIDVYPTLCELALVPPQHALSGKSLVSLMRNSDAEGKSWELTELSNGKSIRTNRFRYTQLPDGEMLFDLADDPNEWNNLASDPSMNEQKSRLRGILESLKTNSARSRP